MNAASPSTMLATPHPCRIIDTGAELPAAIVAIHEGSLDAVIVKSIFPAPLVAEVAARLAAGDGGLPTFHPPDGRKGLVYGWPLVANEDSLDHYLEMAERFRSVCSSLFGAAGEPEQTIARALGSLAGGREASVPRADDGRPYLPATIRYLSAGDLLPLHYENEVFRWPAVRSLAAKLDRSTLMSFYVPMVLSERGGELRLYRATCLGDGSARIGEVGGDEAARPLLESEGYEVLRPGPGDLLVFDGGRRYHEVTRIEGRDRWTMGGVLALSADHRSLHFWS